MPTPQKIYAGSTLIYESPITVFPKQVQSSSAVTVTADATANTKGAWSQLISSTSAQSDWLYIICTHQYTSGTDTTFLVDIGTGASGSETVRIENIGLGYRSVFGSDVRSGGPLLFPIRVASGTRIAARAQSNRSGAAGSVTIGTLSGAARSAMPTTLDTIGAATATSAGTAMPTSNTYVQLTSSTTQAYQALVASATATGSTLFNNQEDSTYTVASGASGSETELFNFLTRVQTTETLRAPGPVELSTTWTGHIPAGTRLAVKQSIGGNSRHVILYGVPYA